MINKPTINDAILELKPHSKFQLTNGDFDTINWLDTGIENQCTKEEVETKLAELNTAYNNLEYSRNRELEYPSWQDQMDMQYHDKKDGTTTWQDAVQAVKDKYPKE